MEGQGPEKGKGWGNALLSSGRGVLPFPVLPQRVLPGGDAVDHGGTVEDDRQVANQAVLGSLGKSQGS